MNNTLPAHRALFSLSFACGATHTQSLKVATIHPCTAPFPHEFYLTRRKGGPRSSQAQVVGMHIGRYTMMMKAKICTQATQRMTGSGVGLMSVWGNGWGGGDSFTRMCGLGCLLDFLHGGCCQAVCQAKQSVPAHRPQATKASVKVGLDLHSWRENSGGGS